MLRLEDSWIWDSWSVDDPDGRHHLFFLKAPRSLGDPELRHFTPSIGHAVSADWCCWTPLPDALRPADTPAWDDLTTWTGSVVRGPADRYHLFYTGASRSEQGLVQRIGRADSEDLVTWTRFGDAALVEADPRWYEKLATGAWHDEAWRDPYVFADPDGDGWHMLVTARVPDGPAWSRGVVGHARSHDLDRWEVQPPLSSPGGFGQLEVLQVVTVEGRPFLLFSCGARELDPGRHGEGAAGGVWSVPGASLLGPWDISASERVDHPSLYAARAVPLREGWGLVGFSDTVDGEFVGEILDPVAVVPRGRGLQPRPPARGTGSPVDQDHHER